MDNQPDIRLFEPTDYDSIKTWWKKHGSFAPKPEHLPATGLIVPDVCAGFLYKTDSAICVFEFVVCNPESSKDDRDKGLETLINAAKVWARINGYKMVYNSSGLPKFIGRLMNAGFVRADTNQTHCFYEVRNE